MLAAIRAFAKSPFAWVLFGALVVAFGMFSNVGDFLKPIAGDWVVMAGSEKVTGRQFKSLFDRVKRQQEGQTGQTITVEQVLEAGFDKRMLQGLEAQVTMAALFKRLGLQPSDELVRQQIRKQTDFFDPISGVFDKATYTRLLAENGFTPKTYDEQLRAEIANDHFSIGMVQGLRLPRTFAAVRGAYALEMRDLTYFTIDAKSVGAVPPPTEEQLAAFLKENAARFQLPAFRVISVVRFTPPTDAKTPVDEALLKKTFDFRKDSLSRPEVRSLVQLSLKDQATAAKAADRLKKGEDPAAVAKSFGVKPIVIADKPQTAVADRVVGAAAFKMASGEVSGAIKGDLSWSVVKVTSVTPGHNATLEEVRPQLEQELRAKAGQKLAYDQSDKFQQAKDGGASFSEAAAKAGAKVVTLAPVTADGRGHDGKPVEGIDPLTLKAAQDLTAGGESDIVEGEAGDYFAVRVEKVEEPATAPLAEVRPILTRALVQREVYKRLQAKAEELVRRIKAGESVDAVAASVGAKVVHVAGLDRQSAGEKVQTLGQGLLRGTFNGKAGDVFAELVPSNEPVIGIGRLDAVRQADTGDLARFAQQSREQMTLQLVQDLGGVQQAAAKKMIKPRTNLHQARVAIGAEPETIKRLEEAEAPAKDKDKKK